MEDLRRQQQEDRERIRALEKQLNAMDVRYRQGLDGLHQDVVRLHGCCNTVSDLQNRITDAERKISSASENFDVLRDRLDKELSGGGGSSSNSGSRGGGFGGSSGISRGGGSAAVTKDMLDNQLRDLEWRVNNTVQRTKQSCSYLENDLKDYFHKELGDLKTVFLDRFDDQAFRIADVELDVGLVKDRVGDHDMRLLKLENITSLMNRRLEKCSYGGSEGGGNRGDGGGWGAGGGVITGGGSRGGTGGGLSGTGGERKNTTEKSLEWRVVANEDQIRHFNTRLKDLSVSGDSLYNKVTTFRSM